MTSDKYPPTRPAAKLIFFKELTFRNHSIDWVIQPEEARDANKKVIHGGGVIYVGKTAGGSSKLSRLSKYFLDFVSDQKAIRLMLTKQYDLIQVKDKYVQTLLLMIVAKLRGIPMFFWIAYPHAEAALYSVKNKTARYPVLNLIRGMVLKYFAYKIIMKYADHTFVQSDQMLRDINKEGIPERSMTPIPSSVDLERVPYKTHRRRDENKTKMLLYVGTLLRVRRLDFLVRVLSEVQREFPECILCFVGKGEMPEDMELLNNEIDRLALKNNVVFTGYLPQEDVWNYIENADICLSPYFPTPILQSTSPTKLVEYMAMGRPIIANHHPEQDEVIRESGCGITVDWEESNVAEAIVRLLSNSESSEEMGRKGREYVERWRSSEVMAQLVEDTYFRIIDNG